ncbi:RiPP maturation radical SAM C-methyltransferase [Actinoplanes oblitus]|uniref:RiPP maturation radical SAM C-methyltransferase n=1 Tax=Actinoplanes oblitus TaxID=3040509 RepID=A0ABY8WCA1_9ACTN|nr:RiPP maturation radical SAM C-methyltransferase [Actinoplanes oblitus]WIM94997.1 RiPP maturation radical SAM C-methyltransferase [Actinoplanes oblitus]
MVTELPLVSGDAPAVPAGLPHLGAGQRADWPVVLVAMPFLETGWPSIQIGLLAAILRQHGYPARTLHANLDFAARLGADYYHLLAGRQARMVADWLFSLEAFGSAAPDPDARLLDDYATELAVLGDAGESEWRDRLLRVRHEDTPAYLDALAADPVFHGVRAVGFTTTFQQNSASFALARRLKQRYPGLVTIFGGANFDGEMGPEWVRAVDCVDMAVVGEADTALPRLLDCLVAGASPGTVPGVVYRDGGDVVITPPAPPLRHLDDHPLPDYTEYFERAGRLGVLPRTGPSPVPIPFETARGCWWGEKHHCTFCGLNGSSMQFRSKSPQRVADELLAQARRYRSFRFHGVDNIVDMAYLTDLFPVLARAGITLDIFYEVKANLNRGQVRALAQGGVTGIQPGIESLSSNVLRLMNKGVRAAQNVNLLRWAAYYGVGCGWNILWGFPGETEQDYRDQAAVLPHLVHLAPPSSAGRLWIERFSPLFTASPTKTPEQAYAYVYPAEVDLRRTAYFFEYDLPGALPDHAYDGVRQGVADWVSAWNDGGRPTLTFWSSPGLVQIYDGRRPGSEGTYTFEGPIADLYTLCSDRPIGAAAAHERLGGRLSPDEIREAFDEFQQRGLMFLDESLALSLALPAGPPR